MMFEHFQKSRLEETPHEFRLMAAIGKMSDFTDEERAHLGEKNAENLDWHSDMKTMRERRQLNAGSTTFIVSSISEQNKFSEGYENCTGLIVSGIEESTGKNITFMTHQRPGSWLEEDAEQFESACRTRLEEFAQRARKGTIDAIVVGGDLHNSVLPAPSIDLGGMRGHGRDFKEGVKRLARLTEALLGIEPRIVGGPMQGHKGSTSVYLDTSHRRVFIFRPEEDAIDIPASEASGHVRKTYWNS